MTKKSKSPIGIFTESIGLYFSNFKQFLKYMSFPVWGQIFGMVLIFGILAIYTKNLPKLIETFPILNDPKYLITLSIAVTIPGLILYIKAFWEYLVAYGAVNSMLDNMLRSGRVYDFDAHTALIKKRSAAFAGLWLLLGLFSIVAICPLFWIICGIFAVYFVLVFQVFTFENESPIGCFKRSLQLVLKHFGSTFLLIALIGAFTYLLIPQIVTKFSDISGITALLTGWIKPIIDTLPQIKIQGVEMLNDKLGTVVIESLIAQIIIQYTLPMRSILWGMWYKELSKNYEPALKKEKKTRKKRPSEKLMEQSHKKLVSKKLDRNILRRAMEKDD